MTNINCSTIVIELKRILVAGFALAVAKLDVDGKIPEFGRDTGPLTWVAAH
jgi:hypothetical protein